MKTKLLLLAVIILIISGCTTPPATENQPDYQATIAVLSSQLEELSAQPTESIPPTSTLSPTNTSVPTSTKKPTSTPTLKPTQDTTQAKAKNFVASAESNGVLIEVERILICANTWENLYKEEGLSADVYQNKPTFIEFIIRVTNNTEKVIQFNSHVAIASADGEQIYFEDYVYNYPAPGWIGDNLSDEILPGSMVRGGLYTGITRSKWDEVKKIIISMPHAFDKDYHRVTSDYLIEIEVGDWGFEPLLDD
jgi:hypothetical protein